MPLCFFYRDGRNITKQDAAIRIGGWDANVLYVHMMRRETGGDMEDSHQKNAREYSSQSK